MEKILIMTDSNASISQEEAKNLHIYIVPMPFIINGEEFYESKRYDINPIIDRVGGGDSFSGGIIQKARKYPLLNPLAFY